jgi:hypothetical protein
MSCSALNGIEKSLTLSRNDPLSDGGDIVRRYNGAFFDSGRGSFLPVFGRRAAPAASLSHSGPIRPVESS